MSLPLTSLGLIALFLPGVAFFYISALRQHRNTELVRTNVLGDISIVFAVSFAVHIALVLIIRFCIPSFYFDAASVIIFYDDRRSLNTFLYIDKYLVLIIGYIFVTTAIGVFLGLLISTRYFGFFFKNKWSRDLYGSRRQLVSVYVMTNIIENNKVLLYRGALNEYLMGPDGNFLYVVLQNAKRYFLDFETDAGEMSDNLDLLESKIAKGVRPLWNYLLIPGGSISNILFEKSPELNVDPSAEKELENLTSKEPVSG